MNSSIEPSIFDKLYSMLDNIVSNPFFTPISTLITILLSGTTLLFVLINHREKHPNIIIKDLQITNPSLIVRKDSPNRLCFSINFYIMNQSILDNTIKTIEYILEDIGKRSTSQVMPRDIVGKRSIDIYENVEFRLSNQSIKTQLNLTVNVTDQYNNSYFRKTCIER